MRQALGRFRWAERCRKLTWEERESEFAGLFVHVGTQIQERGPKGHLCRLVKGSFQAARNH